MVEGGPTIAADLLRADLIDEAALFRAPLKLGQGIDAFEGLPLTALTQSLRFKSDGSEAIGVDTVEIFRRR
jgi:diaminohydroxyphosphoribosylaminopyrimidine deaminase/5-amino-6-(5-phosphoribosylamino)uracil reductase